MLIKEDIQKHMMTDQCLIYEVICKCLLYKSLLNYIKCYLHSLSDKI